MDENDTKDAIRAMKGVSKACECQDNFCKQLTFKYVAIASRPWPVGPTWAPQCHENTSTVCKIKMIEFTEVVSINASDGIDISGCLMLYQSDVILTESTLPSCISNASDTSFHFLV